MEQGGWHKFLPTHLCLAALLYFAVLSTPIQAAALGVLQQRPPLTVQQIEKLIAITPDEAIAREIKARGISFQVDNNTVDRFKRLGAGTQTVKALQEAASSGEIKISLFDYEKCRKHEEDFQLFASLLNQDFLELARELRKNNSQLQYLSGFTFVKEQKHFNMSNLQEMDAKYWKNSFIQILSGSCVEKDGTVSVISFIHLGPYSGSLPGLVTVRFRVSAEEFAPMHHAHTVLLLYSLANEALENKRGIMIARDYLNSARNIVMQINKPDQVAALQPIRDAIEGMLQELMTKGETSQKQ